MGFMTKCVKYCFYMLTLKIGYLSIIACFRPPGGSVSGIKGPVFESRIAHHEKQGIRRSD